MLHNNENASSTKLVIKSATVKYNDYCVYYIKEKDKNLNAQSIKEKICIYCSHKQGMKEKKYA